MNLDPLDGLAAPPTVRATLQTLRTELVARAGENLSSLLLFGGLARGRYRPGRSDVNLLLLLLSDDVAALRPLAVPLHDAWRAVRVEPLILAQADLPAAARVFPTKFLEMQAHHLRLHGSDPLATLQIPPDELRRRVEQELRNLGARLRRECLSRLESPEELIRLLAEAARPLAISLRTLLHLAGEPLPRAEITAELYTLAARRFGLDGMALARLADLRQDGTEPADPVALLDDLLRIVRHTAELAAEGKEAPR